MKEGDDQVVRPASVSPESDQSYYWRKERSNMRVGNDVLAWRDSTLS